MPKLWIGGFQVLTGNKMEKWSKEAKQRHKDKMLNKPITPQSSWKKQKLLDEITDDFPRY